MRLGARLRAHAGGAAGPEALLRKVVQQQHVRRVRLPRLPGYRRLSAATVATEPAAVAIGAASASGSAAAAVHAARHRADVHVLAVLREPAAHVLPQVGPSRLALRLRHLPAHLPDRRQLRLRDPDHAATAATQSAAVAVAAAAPRSRSSARGMLRSVAALLGDALLPLRGRRLLSSHGPPVCHVQAAAAGGRPVPEHGRLDVPRLGDPAAVAAAASALSAPSLAPASAATIVGHVRFLRRSPIRPLEQRRRQQHQHLASAWRAQPEQQPAPLPWSVDPDV